MTRPKAPRTLHEQADRRNLIYTALMMLVAFGLLTTFGILYTEHKSRVSDERWCDLVIGMDDNYRSAPVSTLPPRVQTFARQIHKLREDLGCRATPLPPPQPTPSVSASR